MENVVKAIQRAELTMRVVSEVNGYIIELGDEGRLLDMQLRELSANIEKEELLIIKDYLRSKSTAEDVLEVISEITHEELMDITILAKYLGYTVESSLDDIEVATRGYRLLNKIPKTPITIIDNIVKTFGNFQHAMRASIEELDEIEGIGEVRAKNIKQGIKRLQEQAIYESRYYR